MQQVSNEHYIIPEGTHPFENNTLGLFTYLRTYARRHDENDAVSTIESWNECITRVVNSANNQLYVGLTPEESQEFFNLLYSLKCSVAGRFLWQLGTKTVDTLGLPSLQNCAYVTVNEPVKPFVWAMEFLMLGAGIGYRILPEDIEKFPISRRVEIRRIDSRDADFIVPDSREGWVRLLGKVLKAHFYSGKGFTYSCCLLRSKGAPIKGFGGLASGPEVLCEGLGKISVILNACAGRKPSSVDVLDIMNIIGMIVVSGNVRRCLPGDAKVHTKNGLISIKDINVGDEVMTMTGYYPVTNKFIQGEQQLIKILTQDGEFRCTPNHKMAVLSSVKDYEWKEASELLPGDRLISTRSVLDGIKTSLPEWNYERPAKNTTCKDIIVPELDCDMAWLIGLFHGDGYTYANRKENGFNAYVSIVVGIDEYDIAEKAQVQLQRFGDNLHVTLRKRKNENSFMVHCQSKQLSWYFDQHIKQPNTTIRIPDFIMRGTIDIRLAYISGVTDADGCVTNRPVQVVATVYREFAKDIQNLLYSCGIESRFNACSEEWPSREGWQRIYNVNLITLRSQHMFSDIPELHKVMKINGKSQRANGFPRSFITDPKIKQKYGLYNNQQFNIDSYDKEFGENIFAPVQVLSLNEDRCEETYDIEVAEVHEFFCDGYLTHNSAQIAIGDCKDVEYLRAKRWDLGNIPNHRAYSNNSVVCNDINDIIDNEEFWAGYEGKGEPYGLINLDLLRKCGRLGETQYSDPTVEGVNPCAEISLSPFEVCCLGELYLPNITSYEELCTCAKYLYRTCKHSLSLPCAFSKDTEDIVHRNMRIGLGVTGYLQATEEQKQWLSPCYEMLRAYDIEYSQQRGFPPSIKISTCKPSGTLSLLAGVTSGVHPGYSQYYIRRVRIASESPLIQLARDHGYSVEYSRRFDGTNDATTQIISFPYSLPENTVFANECTAVQQLEYVKRLQTDWSDNSISVTVTYRKEELSEIKEWLREHYNNCVKTVSFLLYSGHGFDQAPIEPISKEKYDEMMSVCRPITSVKGICHTEEDEENIGQGECVGGVCPIR